MDQWRTRLVAGPAAAPIVTMLHLMSHPVAGSAEVPGPVTDGVQRIQAVDRAIVLLKAVKSTKSGTAALVGACVTGGMPPAANLPRCSEQPATNTHSRHRANRRTGYFLMGFPYLVVYT